MQINKQYFIHRKALFFAFLATAISVEAQVGNGLGYMPEKFYKDTNPTEVFTKSYIGGGKSQGFLLGLNTYFPLKGDNGISLITQYNMASRGYEDDSIESTCYLAHVDFQSATRWKTNFKLQYGASLGVTQQQIFGATNAGNIRLSGTYLGGSANVGVVWSKDKFFSSVSTQFVFAQRLKDISLTKYVGLARDKTLRIISNEATTSIGWIEPVASIGYGNPDVSSVHLHVGYPIRLLNNGNFMPSTATFRISLQLPFYDFMNQCVGLLCYVL